MIPTWLNAMKECRSKSMCRNQRKMCEWKNGKIFHQNIKYLIRIMCHRDVRNIEIHVYKFPHYAKNVRQAINTLVSWIWRTKTLLNWAGRISKQSCTADSSFSKQHYVLWQSQYILHCSSQYPNTMSTMNARLPTSTQEWFRSALACRMSLETSVK